MSKALLIERGLNDVQQDRESKQKKRYKPEPQKGQNSRGKVQKQGTQNNTVHCSICDKSDHVVKDCR